VLSDNDDASSKFSSLCEWDCGIEYLEHAAGDVYSDENISGAEHVLIEHVAITSDDGVQQNAFDHEVQQNAVMMAVQNLTIA